MTKKQRILIVKIMTLAIQKSRLNKPIFVSFSGHVNYLRLACYDKRWDDDVTATHECKWYDEANSEKLLNAIEFMEGLE